MLLLGATNTTNGSRGAGRDQPSWTAELAGHFAERVQGVPAGLAAS
jgi:hypothetical protein